MLVQQYYDKKSLFHEAITISNTSIGFTNNLYLSSLNDNPFLECIQVFCTLESNDIRWTVDGTTPSSTVGHPLYEKETLTIDGIDDITNFRAIRISGDGTLRCTFKFAHK